MDKGVLPELKVTVLPLGQEFAPGPVTDEQLAALGVGNADVVLANAESRDTRASTAEQDMAEPSGALVDLSSAPVVPLETGVNLARACEEPGTAVARIEPPPAASRDGASADIQVAAASGCTDTNRRGRRFVSYAARRLIGCINITLTEVPPANRAVRGGSPASGPRSGI